MPSLKKLNFAGLAVATLTAGAVILAGNSGAIVQPVYARWKPEFANTPYRAWYARQHDKEGWSCCDHADGHAVYDPYFKGGKWYIPIEGTDHEILPHQLLDGPNPTGHAVAWYDGTGDHVLIRP